jgi:hypothetical protein
MEAGPDALPVMLSTLPTFHADRSPLKAVASQNTARTHPTPHERPEGRHSRTPVAALPNDLVVGGSSPTVGQAHAG